MYGLPYLALQEGAWSMIRKSGSRVSDKIMLKQED
jgi:hypothetical protein